MKVVLSGTLQRFAEYVRDHEVEAATLGGAYAALIEQTPRLKRVLLDEDGLVREAHSLFLNGEQVRRGDEATPVGPDDTLEIVTAIAGG